MSTETLENGNQTEQEQSALSVREKVRTSLLPGNRPIEPTHLNIVRTYTSVGSDRPVTSSGIQISDTLAISGNRPISVSTLKISETYVVMGNRPVASNEIDDPASLMGFID